jgi:copper chaperone NosL
MARRALRSLLAWPLLVVAACGSTPPPIAYGTQGCDFCRMQIADPRYGGQLITTTGKVYAFDSVECLAEFAATFDESRVRMVRVADFTNPGTLLPVEDARFYQDPRHRGPMGGGWLAVSAEADSSWLALNVGGTPSDWQTVRRLAVSGDLHGEAPPATADRNDGR